MKDETPILQVKQLHTHFFSKSGVVKAVDGVNFDIKPGETLGIVGESGSGKSITAMSIMRLIPSPPGKIVNGEVLFKGEDLLKKSEKQMRKIRGKEISMIFQDPMTSLNPVLTVEKQMIETILTHENMNKSQARERAVELMDLVGIPESRNRLKNYPHEFSGGMRQRVMIAMALACNPEVLIADEPTTALDVTIQAQILELLNKLQKELGMAIVMITHDLGVVAEVCDRVMVMYAGKPVEFTEANSLFANPKHPYTWGLMNSIPKITSKKEKLEAIEGAPPDLRALPQGCSFAPRCKHAMEQCLTIDPSITKVEESHHVRCLLYEETEKVIST
ncbi:ABC transporter ATP-binding protein [Aquibacillus sp. 3ASR75-11]|uniref:ABC transporter ATP-binding protein n=1 Tax=Terrihalobacillus insolitus TaxID=2950438 RepID=A0A9X4AKF2_9BACI|nr:ABC transporter ATP-binding protein [Terrihalobacillus insolitus]MDC3412281.1 ABC transporter ATP-binding protein [Terrihalobacillus insolitus]MDC3423026.1 ABC transporter ATP-binding protein [Terrihalobacillus insolitus]